MKKKDTAIIIGFSVMFLLLVLCFIYIYKLKTVKPNILDSNIDNNTVVEESKESTESNEEEKPTSNPVIINDSSIKALAKDASLSISTEIKTKVSVDNTRLDNTNPVDLSYENGKLYLVSGTHKSLVKNFDEEVVMMEEAFNSVSLPGMDILILTTKGNLYVLKGVNDPDIRFNDEIIELLKANNPVVLDIVKLNDETKVLALTDKSIDKTCDSSGTRLVYAEDKQFRTYNNFEVVTDINEEIDCDITE